MNATRLADKLAEIADYTAAHPDLLKAHHFLYDLKVPKDGSPKFVVMGVNPGETAECWRTAPGPTEETSRFDFHDLRQDRSAIRWSRMCCYFLGEADYVLAEIFFWSSSDLREFVKRYGPLAKSEHLSFCRRMNVDLIDAYQPRAVIVPGISVDRLCREIFELAPEETIRHGGVRVVERYTDGVRPWLFTKHWTGSRGFTAQQREAIRTAIQRLDHSAD